MANVVEIEVRTVDKTDFPKMEAAARSSGTKVESNMQRVGSVAGGMLVAGLTEKLTAFASRGLDFVLGGIDLASSFNESLSKVQTIFGESSGEIEAWAETAADSIGLAEGAALDAAGTFGNMFDQLGFGADVTADMSTSMIQLAADMASFHNADITEVIDAQSAAFRGEYDSLQRFIPTANAAAIEQQALAMTGKAAASELTAQEKALAAYTFMLENAGAASGDFARTADSAANAQRRAAAAMTNMQTELGQRLLPAMELVTQAQLRLADAGERYLLPALDKVGQFISDNEGKFRALGEVLSDVGDVIGDQLGGMLEQLDLTAVEALAIAIGVVLAGAAVLLAGALAGAALAASAFAIPLALVVQLVGSARKVIELFSDALDTLADKVPGVATGLEVLGTALGLIGTAVGDAIGGLGEAPVILTAIQEAIAGITVDPDTLNQLTAFADSALGTVEAEAAAAAASVEELEAELQELSDAIAEMAGQYDTTAVFRNIEEDMASLVAQAQGLETQVYNNATGFDRSTEAGRNLEAGMEGLHGEVLTLAEQFVNGDISASTFTSGQQRVREAIGAVASEMGLTQAETDALIARYAAVPEDVQTRVDLIGNAQAKIGELLGEFGRLPNSKSITVNVIDNATRFFTGITNAANAVPRTVTRNRVTTRASGGAAEGLTMVGEQGAELVDMPPGSFVHSGPASGALAGGGAGGGTTILNLFFAGSLYAERDLEAIVANLERRGGTR